MVFKKGFGGQGDASSTTSSSHLSQGQVPQNAQLMSSLQQNVNIQPLTGITQPVIVTSHM